MRTLQKRGRTITIITPEEFDQVDWSHVTHGCVFLDIWGKLHLELGQKGFHIWFHNTNWFDLLFRQKKLYAQLATRMINKALCAPPKDLLGGFHFLYKAKAQMLIPFNVALLSRAALEQRGDLQRNPQVGEIRQRGFEQMWALFDQIAAALHAKLALMSSAPIAEEKLKHFGCVRFQPQGWLRYYCALFSFPYRQQQHYVKIYHTNQ